MPLRDVADIVEEDGPAIIGRENARRRPGGTNFRVSGQHEHLVHAAKRFAIMVPLTIAVEPDTAVADVICTMTAKKVDAVAVVHGLRLVGLVTQREARGAADPLPFEFHLIEDPRVHS